MKRPEEDDRDPQGLMPFPEDTGADDPYDDEVLAALLDDPGEVAVTPRPLDRPTPKPRPPAPLPMAGVVVAMPPAPAPAPAPPPPPAQVGHFHRGDAVEIAEQLAEDLRRGSPERVVHDEGLFWRYDPACGVYREVDLTDARNQVARYAGWPVGDGKDVRPLSLSQQAITGAVQVCADQLRAKEFFHDAPPGVVFRNAFVSLGSGGVDVAAHSAAYRARHALPFDYDPHAPCPRWRTFLEEIFIPIEPEEGPPLDDGADRAALLQEFVGAALFGVATRHAKVLVMVGEGSNGKSVVTKVVASLFPAAATSAVSPQAWGKGFSLADLVGKRLNIVSEIPVREVGESDRFKAVVTGDTVMAERKFQPQFKFAPTAGHLFACNTLPVTRDHSQGYWRRFMVLMFNREIAEHEQDRLLPETLRGELAGIIAWAIEGAGRLHARGRYTSPKSSELAKADWQVTTDQVRAFVTECVVATRKSDRDPADPKGCIPRIATSVRVLYETYQRWATRSGHHPLAIVEFGRRLKPLFDSGRTSTERYYFAQLTRTGEDLIDLPPGMRSGFRMPPRRTEHTDPADGSSVRSAPS